MRSDPVARRRYATKRWKDLRRVVLCNNPACMRCGQPATTVDHRVPHKGDEDLFFSLANLQALCKRCHDSWKARMENGRLDTECSSTGYPVDPGHPWNKK